jgi:hypothetical protein
VSFHFVSSPFFVAIFYCNKVLLASAHQQFFMKASDIRGTNT